MAMHVRRPDDEKDATSLAEDTQRALNTGARFVYKDLADDYDRHLLDDCAYASPDIVAGQIAQHTSGSLRVFDVGAGTGLMGRALVRAGVEAHIIGVDLVEIMLRRNQCEAYTQCIVADAAGHLPVRPGTFDAAVSTALTEHILDPRNFLAEFLRTVKSGGIAVFTFVPNQRGHTEIFDRNAGLLSHDRNQIARTVKHLSGEVIDRTQFNAYRNGDNWVQHEAVTVSCH